MKTEVRAESVPDGEPIALARVRVQTETSSWCWSLEATVIDPAQARTLLPTPEAPGVLRVTIQGYPFEFLIEGYRLRRRHGSLRYELQGRSHTAMLAEPHAPKRRRAQDGDRQIQQLAAEELDYTGFTLDWQAANWIVPGGVYSYRNRTPMEAIQTCAQAAGAFIYSARAQKKVYVRPRYPYSPPDWSQAPAVELPLSSCHNEALSYHQGDRYAIAWVSGDSEQGVIVRGYRASWDTQEEGRTAPPMAHRLITHVTGGRALARYRIDSSGPWTQSRLSQLMPHADEDPDALKVPGSLVRLTEGERSQTGLVRTVRLEATPSEKRLSVIQLLDVELREESDE